MRRRRTLACKRQRIYDLVSRRTIPHRKEGSRLLFKLSHLDAWIEDFLYFTPVGQERWWASSATPRCGQN
jgi:excisionase family DNA binding protein